MLYIRKISKENLRFSPSFLYHFYFCDECARNTQQIMKITFILIFQNKCCILFFFFNANISFNKSCLCSTFDKCASHYFSRKRSLEKEKRTTQSERNNQSSTVLKENCPISIQYINQCNENKERQKESERNNEQSLQPNKSSFQLLLPLLHVQSVL